MKKILLISGDPNSINSEIIYKCLSKISAKLRKKIYIISNYELLVKQFKKLKFSLKLVKVENIFKDSIDNKIKVIDIDFNFKSPFETKSKETSKFIINCLLKGHNLAQEKGVAGLINCAIDKKYLNKEKIGVTEFLSLRSRIKKNSEVMLIKSRNFAVSPLTTHIDIRDVPKKLSSNLIITKAKTIEKDYKKIFKKKPRIGILGLNPHNAEFRKNSEEKKIIKPAILKLKKLGIRAEGPLVADTVFLNDYKKYDVILGMYHDQVLAPFKALFKFDAINLTLGLKYLRVSPDHGTAKKMISLKKANPTSLINCVNFINKFGQ